MSELVTIRSFVYAVDFELAKAYLESNGIECFGRDEINNRAYISNANGGVKLQVRTEQAEQAVKLLIEGGYLKEEDLEPSAELKWIEKIIGLFKRK